MAVCVCVCDGTLQKVSIFTKLTGTIDGKSASVTPPYGRYTYIFGVETLG